MNKKQRALEFRRALQLLLESSFSADDVDTVMAVASVYPNYGVGRIYKVKEIISYGENGVGDPQLYQVLQNHTSSKEWEPDKTPTLYKKIGVTSEGYPQWVQPLGSSDAYNTGDIVSYHGTIYKSKIDGNVWSPIDYPTGWEEI